MKLRLIARRKAARPMGNIATPDRPPHGQHTPAPQAEQAEPRSIGNPYGRLFTQDNSFADLVGKQAQVQGTAPQKK